MQETKRRGRPARGEQIDPQSTLCTIKLPFNSNMFRTILNANKDMESGFMYISSKGLMKLEFKVGDISSEYYMVRKESTNF